MEWDHDWWKKVLAPFAKEVEFLYREFCRRVDTMTDHERLHLDAAISQLSPAQGNMFERAAGKLIDDALLATESGPERDESFLHRFAYRDRQLGRRGKRFLSLRLHGLRNPRPPLREQSERASALLLGKTVKSVVRSRRGELAIEFTDGALLSVGATPVGLDFKIETDRDTWAGRG